MVKTAPLPEALVVPAQPLRNEAQGRASSTAGMALRVGEVETRAPAIRGRGGRLGAALALVTAGLAMMVAVTVVLRRPRAAEPASVASPVTVVGDAGAGLDAGDAETVDASLPAAVSSASVAPASSARLRGQRVLVGDVIYVGPIDSCCEHRSAED